MDEQSRQRTPIEEFPPARELAVWLRAIQSFFNQANHPFAAAERAEIASRNFKCETHIVRDALMRCLHLLGSVERGEPLPVSRDIGVEEEAARSSPFARDDLPGLADAKDSLGELSEALKDGCKLGEALLESPSVGFGGWAGLGRVLERELRRSDAASIIITSLSAGSPPKSQDALVALARRIAPDELGEDMSEVFDAFARLLELLRFIELSLAGDAQLKRLLPVFTLIHEETKALLDFIEGRALRVEGIERETQEILDGTAYAIRMELRKAFEHELTGFCSLRQPPQLFAKVESASGLLRDCYQQSVAALAQCFDPAMDGRQLFPSFQTKLDQSLTLRRDLWALVNLVRRAPAEGEAFEHALLLEHLSAFSEGSQRHLMYKDWEPFERFVEEIESARPPADFSQALHRFEAFLETLFGQVNMRAVLADHPFDPKSAEK
ncbi:MAG: hypothetical protein H7Z38_03520 [Rubrivivax sp.]|nr:hypothetical protein [Pyrinomonadaceae bacterium]